MALSKVEPYREKMIAKLLEVQPPAQPALPPVVILQRPQEIRKRIEDFLDYLETLSPAPYQAEFDKIPNLTESV
jgi:hypothetical protein